MDEHLHVGPRSLLRLLERDRQLLLRRSQHGLHLAPPLGDLGLPPHGGRNGLLRLGRKPRPRLEPRRPLHGAHGAHEPRGDLPSGPLCL